MAVKLTFRFQIAVYLSVSEYWVHFSFPYGHSHLFITSGVVSLEIRAFQSTLFIASCCVCCHVGSIVNCCRIVSEVVVTNARSTEFPFTFSDFTFDTVHVSAMCLIWSSNSVEAKSRWITVGKVFGTYESVVRIFVGANYLVKGQYFCYYYYHHHHLFYAGYLYLYSWDKLCP